MTHKPDSSVADAIVAIQRYNVGRDPERLAMKYQRMANSPFAFLRGTCHLFYAALPDTPLFCAAPLAWCCGDLHGENFGSYRGDNHQVYFDINDFDEAVLAPATWDLLRLLSSILCAAEAAGMKDGAAAELAGDCLAAWREAQGQGKPLWVERETSVGPVRDLLTALRDEHAADFLDKRTVGEGAQRRLKLDTGKALPASEAEVTVVQVFMAAFAADQAEPESYRVLDVARRIAGTGSLGVPRFVVLVAGKGDHDGPLLLDLKQARASALAPHLARLGVAQPAWADAAHRIVAVQQHMQAVDHAFLRAVRLDGQPWILKALQPSEDRVDIGDGALKRERLEQVVDTLGRILAWDQLRASGRGGAANADALMTFARDGAWADEMMAAARDLARLTRRQWQAFTRLPHQME